MSSGGPEMANTQTSKILGKFGACKLKANANGRCTKFLIQKEKEEEP